MQKILTINAFGDALHCTLTAVENGVTLRRAGPIVTLIIGHTARPVTGAEGVEDIDDAILAEMAEATALATKLLRAVLKKRGFV